MKQKNILLIICAVFAMMMSSCNTWEKVAYFQDRDSISNIQLPETKHVILKPGDKILIFVKCEDAETSDLFNMAYTPRTIGSGKMSYGTSQGAVGYTIDKQGYIDFPTLNRIYVAGKTREEIAKIIKDELAKQGQARNAVVTVEFMDLAISVIGEVARPGRYNIDRDVLTVLDAISMAGDLTIDVKRGDVMVMRQDEEGHQTVYSIDLTSAEQVMKSPAYYLQQNDVIYVTPNEKKARFSTVNGNNILSASFWLSVATTVVTILTFIFAISK